MKIMVGLLVAFLLASIFLFYRMAVSNQYKIIAEYRRGQIDARIVECEMFLADIESKHFPDAKSYIETKIKRCEPDMKEVMEGK